MSAPPNAPWYRHGWPWLLMLPPLAAVGAGVTILTFALRTDDTLAVEDYARIETLNEALFAEDRAAAELGLEGTLSIDNDADGVRIELALAAPHGDLPPSLELKLQHATLKKFDRRFVLTLEGGRYRAVGAALPAEHYALEIAPADRSWRLAARANAWPAQIALEAGPKP